MNPDSPQPLPHELSSRDLRAFVIVADLLSYTKAADALGYTEPAIHHQVKRLEINLQCELLRKSGRGIELTEAGDRLLPLCRTALGAIESLQLQARAPGAIDVVRLACGTVTSSCIIPAAIGRFAQVYPEIPVELSVSFSEGVVRRVESGEADLGISTNLDTIPLKETTRLAYWKGEPISAFVSTRKTPSFERPFTIVAVKRTSPPLRIWLAQLAQRGFPTPHVHFLPSAEVVKRVCESSEAVAFLPESSPALECQAGLLRKVDGLIEDVVMHIWICYRHDDMSDAAAAFLRFLLASRNKTGPSGAGYSPSKR
jgi:DNA-binding transcriptional LysR family regulator